MTDKYSLDDLIKSIYLYNSKRADEYTTCLSSLNRKFGEIYTNLKKLVGNNIHCTSNCKDCALYAYGLDALKNDLTKHIILNDVASIVPIMEKVICRGDCAVCPFATENGCKIRDIRTKFTNNNCFDNTDDIKQYINEITVVVVETVRNTINN